MSYFADKKLSVTLPARAKNTVVEEILSNITCGLEWNIGYSPDDTVITMGSAESAELSDGECVTNVTDFGVYVKGRDYASAIRGALMLFMKTKFDDSKEVFFLENECKTHRPTMDFRAVHICIFPETSLDFFKKCVRSAALVGFSHVIFEFWGMLQFDCLKELSWPFAFTKDEIKEIVFEANALGLEVIPMFNHLGHASSCRAMNGKHVVLDQKPSLEYMFTSYGWVWNIEREDVRELHRKIRNELIELCGEGKYFHLGCDEAYYPADDPQKAIETVGYLNFVSEELQKCGRKGIIWHDMMLSRDEAEGYVANASTDFAKTFRDNLTREIIIADWQYGVHNEPWKSSPVFKNEGFDVVCCPWDNHNNINDAIDTVNENKLFGIIHTTWHTLFKGYSRLVYAGMMSYNSEYKSVCEINFAYSAHVARKAMPSAGDYEKSGWSEKMMGPGLV
ncbi:MAG: family 20 glycosylhydrolase [Clostridia bacterium]|nr:family 20 glycosylhydrolase [Clostridia bacterium]